MRNHMPRSFCQFFFTMLSTSDRCVLRIGSYNVGIQQNMLASKNVQSICKHLGEIIATCVEEWGLHIMNFCEVGGHMQGLHKAGINIRDLTIFESSDGPRVSVQHNYLTAWNFEADAEQAYVQETQAAVRHTLSEGGFEWELVLHCFQTISGVRVRQANFHIRTPHGKKSPKRSLRQRVLCEALKLLGRPQLSDGVSQPVVEILLGDVNLDRDAVEESLHGLQLFTDDAYKLWHVHTTLAAKSGDLVIVRGAHVLRVIPCIGEFSFANCSSISPVGDNFFCQDTTV